MSDPSSVLESISEVPTADAIKAEHQISLIDEERSAEEPQDAEPDDSEPTATASTPGPSPLTKKLTSGSVQQSLKREWTRKKYAKYNRDRYDVDAPPDEDMANQPGQGEAASAQQTSYLERGRAKAKAILKRKRTLGQGKDEPDNVIDILYENQRGVFFFGIPKYSSSGLLPSDPAAWQNPQFRTSPVDIRNAQVPDPSWEWVWKSWYVDMSRDVDEEGWEYSFKFTGGFGWHGNHPWFHSFVRRRRWLRLRRRKDPKHHTREKAHELTAEYFTIHPKTLRSGSEDRSRAGSSEMARLKEKLDEEPEDVEKMDIEDIASLMQALKKAAVDREKLVAVRKFVNAAGDELYYLSERMPDIMNLFVFQSSRRQLLVDLLRRFDEVHKRKESLVEHRHEDDSTQKEHDTATRHAENLMNAVKAADEQVKKLEYWSDIKGMAQKGETLEESEGGHWDRSKWQGLSSPTSTAQDHPKDAFTSLQAASEGAHELHKHPEHVKDDSKAPSKKSSVWFETKESSEDTGAYSTAAESTSELPRKGKGKERASNLDGVDESEEDYRRPSTALAASQSAIPELPERKKHSVQIVDPVPEPGDEAPQGSS